MKIWYLSNFCQDFIETTIFFVIRTPKGFFQFIQCKSTFLDVDLFSDDWSWCYRRRLSKEILKVLFP